MRTTLLAILIISISSSNSYGQFWKDLKDKIRNIGDAASEVNRTTQEVDQAVKGVKAFIASWKPDTAQNIKYSQIPDYRRLEEVPIKKNQKLKFEGGSFSEINWSPETKFYNNLFPSFIIGWANYRGDKYEDMGSSLGFRIQTRLRDVVIKWEISCSDKTFFDTDSGYLNLDAMKSTSVFMPKIKWNYRNLIAHKSNMPVTITFKIIDPKTGSTEEKVERVNLRSVNDCILSVDNTAYHYLFSSYVNEDHSKIDGILKKMLDTQMINHVTGYQTGSKQDVLLQVAALWKVLNNLGFKYSSITTTSGNTKNERIFTQSVRTFDQVLTNKQANCVDGTVFMASILERIGINTVIITVPGHCFLGFFSGNGENRELYYLETTLISSRKYRKNPALIKKKELEILSAFKNKQLSKDNSAALLDMLIAMQSGNIAYEDCLTRHGREAIRMFDIKEYRNYIKPIPELETLATQSNQ